jgi:hypothetical protein
VSRPIQGTAYFPAIEKRYGRPVSHWQALLSAHRAQHPDARFMQQVAWLKAEHGMGHGHATALVAATPQDVRTGTHDGGASR